MKLRVHKRIGYRPLHPKKVQPAFSHRFLYGGVVLRGGHLPAVVRRVNGRIVQGPLTAKWRVAREDNRWE